MKCKRKALLFVLLCPVIWPGTAWSFHFVPNRVQWDSWPPICKARYSISGASDGTEFARAVDPAEVERWRAYTGQYVWNNMHHYCSGIAWHFRAKLESDPQRRAEYLRHATAEIEYTYRHLQPGMPLYSTVSAAMASVWADRGQTARAVGYMKSAIAAQPTDPSNYVAMSAIYQKQGNWDRARATLLEGDNATEGTSAEIAYYLGLVSLESGDKEAAVTYARKAYEMGYPLPGLRRMLEAAGLQP